MTGRYYTEGPVVDVATVGWAWAGAAACRGEDVNLFFGPEGERQPDRDERERVARDVCSQCPVRVACAEHALTKPERDGLWGGMTPEERRRERRNRQRRAAGWAA